MCIIYNKYPNCPPAKGVLVVVLRSIVYKNLLGQMAVAKPIPIDDDDTRGLSISLTCDGPTQRLY